jgi:phosphatidylserine/phosphatidylglycerophosphate/cardiolipin synthase-like enzyme
LDISIAAFKLIQVSEVSFVITAPQEYASRIAYENNVRQTHGVLIDILISAQQYVIFSSPYLRDLETSNRNINAALLVALKRGVSVSIIGLESELSYVNLNQYVGYDVRIYKPANLTFDNALYSHSKFCLADGQQVYLGSANFTFSGLNKNFEMGVYSQGSLAKQVESLCNYMIAHNFFIRVR